MKKVVIILALVLTSSATFAQDTPTPAAAPEAPASKFTAAVDVVYPYFWRGVKLNYNKLAFQPYASYAFTDKLTLGVWGTTNFSSDEKSYNEFDWYVSYQTCTIAKIMLSDYYFDGTKKSGLLRGSYFGYGHNTPHIMDFSVLLNFADKGVPLDFQWNTIIGGNDYKADGNRAFSTYAEAGYTISLKDAGIDFRPFLGAAVINEAGLYGLDKDGNGGFAITNAGLNVSKSIKISDKYEIPVFVRYIYNQNGRFDKDGSGVKIINSFISGGVTFKIL